MNTTISISLNTFAYLHPLVKIIAIFFASYLQYIIAVAILIFVFKKRKKVKKNILIAASAVLSGSIALLIIKPIIIFFWHVPRPYVALQQIHLLVPPDISEKYQSFPSGHALFFFAIGFIFYMYNKKWGYFFLTLATLMGIGRVMVGAHYPLDILGGAIIAMLVSFCLPKLIKLFLPKNNIYN